MQLTQAMPAPSQLIQSYITERKHHSSFFRNLSPAERISLREEVLQTKHKIDELELTIIHHILQHLISYDNSYAYLKKYEFHHFLDKSEKIQNFITSNHILKSVGFDIDNRNQKIKEFEILCEEAWSDHIITSEERFNLNAFCSKNLIDRSQQAIIENRVSSRFNEGIDIESTVEYYFIEENKQPEEIRDILNKEYRLSVELKRIEEITNLLNEMILEDDEFKSENSRIEKTITFSDNKVFIVKVDDKLNSGFEFEIAYVPNDTNSFKILVNNEHYHGLNSSQKIELITDGICYHIAPSSETNPHWALKMFLEMKSNIRYQVKSQF